MHKHLAVLRSLRHDAEASVQYNHLPLQKRQPVVTNVLSLEQVQRLLD
jgi:hypothetical protein